MFIEFRVTNYRSIGEEQILSLVPAQKQRDYLNNVLSDGKNESLNAVAIYGANGSGKSNILAAIRVFKEIIQTSARYQSVSRLKYDPFLLRQGWENKPTRFEMTFAIDGDRYRYGFEYNEGAVLNEWLFRKMIGRETPLFEREKDVIQAGSGFKGKTRLITNAIDATKDNSLFLSTCDMFNVDEAKVIFEWLSRSLHVDGLNTEKYGTEKLIAEGSLKDQINDYLLRLNLGPIGYEVIRDEDIVSSPRIRITYDVFSSHQLYDETGKPTTGGVSWKLMERESSGSIKAFQMGGPIIFALSMGSCLFIDEIEAKMHPLITLDTIDLFLDKSTNPLGAQLIFATHDTNLLSYAKLRRDQIYFAEKNKWESTEIYSLSDFVYIEDGKAEKERPDTDKERRYIEGRYGAIPMLTAIRQLQSINNPDNDGE